MLSLVQGTTWDLRSLPYGDSLLLVSLMIALAVIGLAMYMILRKRGRKLTGSSDSGQ
jgi:hypothetical protein